MPSVQNELRFLIAASGSGGHLIPAVLIAESIKQKIPGADIRFIGVGRPLEAQLIDSKGFKRYEVEMHGLKKKGVSGILTFASTFPKAWSRVGQILKEFTPHVVIGVGGYASVLPILKAWLSKTPTWIHEAELKPGMANWLLSWVADKISLGFTHAQIPRQHRAEYTGHPVRRELAEVDTTTIQPDAPRRVLVLGGSQGAAGLDKHVPRALSKLPVKNIEVVHQARKENADEVKKTYADLGIKSHVVPFIDDMPGAYDWSDVIISRSGAGAVMEIGAINRPTIFVPYPHQQGKHQTKNAMTLAEQGKAIVLEEEPDFPNKLSLTLLKLFDPEVYRSMKQKPYETRALGAADRIAEGCLKLAQAKVFMETGAREAANS